MTKTLVAKFFTCSIAAVLLWALTGCAAVQNHLEPPKVSLNSIEVLEYSGFSVRFALFLNIQNPNPIPIPISGLGYNLSLNGNEVMSGVSSSALDLGAFGESEVRLESATNFFGMMGFLTELLSEQFDEFEYQLDASIGVRGFSKAIEVTEVGVVPLAGSSAD